MKLSRRAVLAGAVATFASRARAQTETPAPVLFVSHGAPLMLPGNEARAAELRAWGTKLPKPRGIVVMTPHFAARRIELGATARGFAMYDLPPAIKRRLPQDLDYPTPPSAALATRVEQLLGPLARAEDRRGFDHTTWMPLLCLFPAADVPVLELGYPYVPERDAFALGKKLAALRDEGILFLASGGMTHNLAAGIAGPPPPFAREFDAWAEEAIAREDADALVDWRAKAPACELAHPDDGGHWRVLLVALGVALGGARPARRATFPIAGFEGALSTRCVELA
ncbi:MAG TPA: class III extradiol ring-cleavage dioxygenase [Labilithrix sp.]|jgi:4,5-DOPA dioxygenase extradiol